MDDIALIGRTVRRCTAVILVGIGVATLAISDSGGASYGVVVALPALLYLTGSLVYEPAQRVEGKSS